MLHVPLTGTRAGRGLPGPSGKPSDKRHTCTVQLAQARMETNNTNAGRHHVTVLVLVKSGAPFYTWDSFA